MNVVAPEVMVAESTLCSSWRPASMWRRHSFTKSCAVVMDASHAIRAHDDRLGILACRSTSTCWLRRMDALLCNASSPRYRQLAIYLGGHSRGVAPGEDG